MTHPLFSCAVPVKGRRPCFDEALASLHRQDLGDDLEIIVQDGDVEPDAGQSDALNKGIAKAKGEWLWRNVTRLAQLFDGNWFARLRDTMRMVGKAI